MTTCSVAANIVSRIPAMSQDCSLNNLILVEQLIQQLIDEHDAKTKARPEPPGLRNSPEVP